MMIDTGASRNFIGGKLVRLLNLQESENKPIGILTANQESVKIGKTVNVKIKMEFYVEFYVFENCVEEVILGNEFIFNNGLILDFKSRKIKINEEEVKILKDEIKDEEDLDRLFFKQLGLIKTDEEKVTDLINRYKAKNEDFKEINVNPVSFKVIDEKIVMTKKKSYLVPIKYKEKAQEEINRLCKEGIIVESEVRYISPVFFIEKKNLDLRLVIDYRNLNKYIIDESFDIPKIYENLMLMGSNEYYSTIDLKNGFNQIPFNKYSQELTGFMILNKTYKYQRIPFGIRSGPKIFQKTISKILEGIDNCFIYIDEIIIYSQDLKKHNEIIVQVLTRLKEYKVRINFEKSSFYNKEIKLLGYFVNKEGIVSDTKYLQNTALNIIPKTKRQVQKIIGVINWYRRFLKNISEKIYLITELLKGEKFLWNNEHTKILEVVKNEIKSRTVLRFPNFKEKFILETDASKIGIGAVLYQEKGVIGYFLKKLNTTEQNYSIVEKELFAILKALLFFKDIIQGYYVEIYSDNKNCVLENNKFTNRMERWKILLNDFNFRIRGIKGINNNIADTLSRNCKAKELKRFNLRETYLNKVKECTEEFVKLENNNLKIKLKEAKELEFLKFVHEISEHSGVITNYYNINPFFKIKNLLIKLRNVIKNCENCKRIKHFNIKSVRNCPIDAKEPFERASTDIYGPFSLMDYEHETIAEHGYFITMTDIFSRVTHIIFSSSITTDAIIRMFKEWAIKYRKPKILIMDNGVQYTSSQFKEFLNKNGVEGRYIPKYTPSANGISERINVTISEILRLNRGEKISIITKKILHKLNENYHTAIKCTPKSLITGFNFYDPRGLKQNVERFKPKDKNQEIKFKPGEKVYLRNFL